MVGDVVKGLPLPAASVSNLYCSHILEHLFLDECRRALAESFRLLAPGGTFRLVVPDLAIAMTEYQLSNEPGAGNYFLEATMLGTTTRGKGFLAFLRGWLGGSKHLWM